MEKRFLKNIKLNNNGFTFLELIIAIFIFLTGILGSYLVVQYFVFTTQVSISRLTASFLAQEGLEIVRNIRDENWLNDYNWDCGLSYWPGPSSSDCNLSFFYGCDPSNYFCEADYNDAGLFSYNKTDDAHYLNFEGQGFYGYGAGSGYGYGGQTKFKRKITIEKTTDINGKDVLKVVVTVSWSEKGKNYQVEARENLYPWWSN